MKRTAASLGILIAVTSTGAGAGTFTVSNTNDSGAGSLRAAITAANGASGPHTIDFSVSGTISPTSALPALTEPTTIAPTTIGAITLLGSSAGAGVDGLTLAAPGCVVQSLIVRGFSGNGIVASSNSNTIGGAGTLRNVVSANGGSGILVTGSGNQVTGNRIGTDSNGSVDDGNVGNGVTIQGGSGNTLDGNLVAGNNAAGIALVGASNNVLDGNVIGLDLAVTNAVPNSSHGIYLQGASSNNQLCGATPSTIAGNGGDGVAILAGSGNRIRGCNIYLNGGPAIDLDRDGALPLDGVTFGDPGDVDSGANGLLNAPVLRSTTLTGVTGKLRGLPSSQQTVDVYTSASCDKVGYGEGAILLASTTVTTDGAGVASFSLGPWTAVSSTSAYTATATDNAGNTSEFSQCATAGRRPVETLALYVPVPDFPFQPPPAALTGSLFGTFENNLPVAAISIFAPGLTLPSGQTGSFVMGDWDGDGFDTVGIYASGGAFFYTNDVGPTSNWLGVWFGFAGKPVVAGRFDGAVAHDCVGVVDNADNWLGSGDTAFALYWTCDLTPDTNPPKTAVWIGLPLPYSAFGHFQDWPFHFVVGDYTGSGVETLAINRGHYFVWADKAQYLDHSSGGGRYAVSGDWDGDGISTFGVYWQTGQFFHCEDLLWHSGAIQQQFMGQPLGAQERAFPYSWRSGGS